MERYALGCFWSSQQAGDDRIAMSLVTADRMPI